MNSCLIVLMLIFIIALAIYLGGTAIYIIRLILPIIIIALAVKDWHKAKKGPEEKITEGNTDESDKPIKDDANTNKGNAIIYTVLLIISIITYPKEAPFKNTEKEQKPSIESTEQVNNPSEKKEEPKNDKIAKGKLMDEEYAKTVENIKDAETAEKALDIAGKIVFGEDSYRNSMAIENPDYGTNGEPEFMRINVNVYIQPGFSGNSDVNYFLNKATAFLKMTQPIDYNEMFFMVSSDFVDEYGNSKESNAIKLSIRKEEVNKINFEEFDTTKLGKLADVFEVEKALKYKGK